ncbi:TetR/AcrR family transcriptional regulator [Pandoraea sputorum]|uniref:HTH-type transcriptional regulator EthR n=1 Tax=Pandoraea sputorum TaxID=93222 RepID=A0A239SDA6_9BURK|nr:TetR/AcrR family transcriptional regulator [Pandoraea sputorum]AJC16463.1 TetR family transcriptional regulator [Pandoraea sputorum]SNU83259.1 HTH-type transcriptional regulator EthR [Pandoraea sputorum]VVE16618.1 TetR family transcriptional regulator [Pandoraea sputorum]VVE80236.1 TetR family transcriptional regulator [Pandoraea sputorum]VVE82810.1 TetR family transcriptional regulator [Pandoraea sputorum]
MSTPKSPATPNAPSAMRKRPMQARAQHTVETIFEATAQVLDEEGEAALTTNRIAKKAGFSIGTLYQYFPTKEAILLAMIARERRRVMDEQNEFLARAVDEGADPERVIRERIRMLIEAFGSGGRVKRSLIKMAWQMDHHENIMQAMREAAEHIAVAMSRRDAPGMRPPTTATVFVLTRAFMGTLRSAVLEDSPLLGTPEFEDELYRLCWGLLRADA